MEQSAPHAAPPHQGHTSPAKANRRYIDLLAERRDSSDLRWAIREWKSRGNYKYGRQLSREQLFDCVLQSDRVRHSIEKLVEEGRAEGELVDEVEAILEQMGHTQDISIIRQFAFVLPKIMKRIYGQVLINPEGIEKLRATIAETPVVLLPTHRSYADFLLVSYVAYHFDLPLPVIAAGMDFMSMAVIGEKLRGSGAFYIRRSFMDNTLYWAVFQEYVQTIVESTGSPLEFFLEGTRSRSGKSLPPKIGLLGCVTESWLRGRLPDLAIVPISISYERTLEEKLYAYELLGVPKPPESTSGLLKAMSVLNESYGNIVINVGDPLSLRSFLSPRVSRHLSSAIPSHLTSLTKPELCAVETMGSHILRKIQQGAVVSVWSLVCMRLLGLLWAGEAWHVPLTALVADVAWLVTLLGKIGGVVNVEGTVEEAVVRSLHIHHHLAALGDDGMVHVQQVHQPINTSLPSNKKKVQVCEGSVSSAVTHLMLQHYINQALHLLVRPGLLACALLSLPQPTTLDKLQSRFTFLCQLFGNDFIFEKHLAGKDFMEGLSVLTWAGEVSVVQGEVQLMGAGGRLFSLLHLLLQPFCLTYISAAHTMAQREWSDNGELVSAVQKHIELSLGDTRLYSALSLDSIRHAIRGMCKTGAVAKHGANGQATLIPDVEKLQTIADILTTTHRKCVLQAKL